MRMFEELQVFGELQVGDKFRYFPLLGGDPIYCQKIEPEEHHEGNHIHIMNCKILGSDNGYDSLFDNYPVELIEESRQIDETAHYRCEG